MQDIIQIHEMDTVAVALKGLSKGTKIKHGNMVISVLENIPRGHKIALVPIAEGDKVMKYGNPIGLATKQILPGEWVHTHNMKTGLESSEIYQYVPDKTQFSEKVEKDQEEHFFNGYRREDGKVGIRNEIWIIPTVGCVNDVVRAIEDHAKKQTDFQDIISFHHPYGCSQLGDDQEHTRQILADLAQHPNAGGVLIVGLGCENSSISELKKYMGNINPQRVRFMVAQECEDEIAEGTKILLELISYVKQFSQEKIKVSELVIGLKCGGSDGLSGITANATVGQVSDLLLAQKGTTILTEVPEMFGAEHLLMNRCADQETFDKTVQMINQFKEYFISNQQPIYENPSPGNKEGGISTLEDKSLGCTQKAGSAKVQDVLKYGERVAKKGLVLLESPGNDMVAVTALAAAGANLILFTTGRGTPLAGPIPTIKISSNTELFQHKKNWIDFDAGELLENGSLEREGEKLYQKVLEVASGDKTKSELSGYHDIAIFKQGVTL